MRRTTMAMALGFSILTWCGPAPAATPGRVCRRECRPRIVEQCGGLTGAELRRCRKPLVRACKASTPAIACPTVAEIERELTERIVRIDQLGDSTLALCEDDEFSLLTPVPFTPDDANLPDERRGEWDVRIADGALTLVLDDETGPFTLARDASGGLLVGGELATLEDGTARCDDPVGPPPVDPAIERELIVRVTRALADRTIVIDAPDGSENQQREIRLCSSGRATDTISSDDGTVQSVNAVTWTLRSSGLLLLVNESGLEAPLGIEFDQAGRLLVDGELVGTRDARVECDDEDLRERLTAALNDTAYFFTIQVLNIPVRVKLGLCATGRYSVASTSSAVGDWSVEVTNGVARLVLDSDFGSSFVPGFPSFPAALEADGRPSVNGNSPIDDPSIVEAACNA